MICCNFIQEWVEVNHGTGDNLAEYPDDDLNVTEHLFPDGNDAISDKSDLKKDHLATLVMSFILRHRLSASAMQDLLTLLNIIVPGCVPSSSYFMKKYFCFDLQNVETHHYCPTCLSYSGKEFQSECASCGAACNISDSSYMLVLPIELQLRQLLERNNFDEFFVQNRSNVNGVADVNDGAAY